MVMCDTTYVCHNLSFSCEIETTVEHTDDNDDDWWMYVVLAYYSIPFVFEMRSLLDWTVFDTSLPFFHWIKLEDIYASAFVTKCST